MESIKKKLERLADRTKKWRISSRRLVQIVKGKTGSSATRALPQLPIEVWENVIDHLWDNQWALRVCIHVCRAWYPPSRFHLHRKIRIRSVRGVKAYATELKQTPELSKRPHDLSILGDDLSTLWPAATLLAPKLPRVETLEIWDSEWEPWTMHRDVFLHLRAFSFTRLDLHRVTFPSITLFGRLVCALRGLVELKCFQLKFTHYHFHHDTFGLYHNRVNIRYLKLWGDFQRTEKLIDFLAYPGISSHLQKLIIVDPLFPAEQQNQWNWQRLLDAASGSLSELRFDLRSSALRTGTEVSTAGLLPSFSDHTSLQRLSVEFAYSSINSILDILHQILPSIKSGQLREIVITVYWAESPDELSKAKGEVKGFLNIHESARHELEEIDNHFSSDSFGLLSRIEFVLTYGSKSIIAASGVDLTTLPEEQSKQQLESLFPKLTERGIFRATMRDVENANNFSF